MRYTQVVEQLLVSNALSGIAGQQLEQPPLRGREPDLLTVLVHATVGQIDDENRRSGSQEAHRPGARAAGQRAAWPGVRRLGLQRS
jgi:transcriptional regulator with GAF, ATPase, and Fis domain